MEITDAIFYLLGALILVSGYLSVTSNKIFRAAVYLLFSMMGIAGLYFWMNYEFIAAVQIVVYVGGIVVLIIFSIFLTHHVGEDLVPGTKKRRLYTSWAAIIAFVLFWVIIQDNEFLDADPMKELTVKAIGTEMLNYRIGGYALPFEVVSILLLAAMIGCIVIALKTRTEPGEKLI